MQIVFTLHCFKIAEPTPDTVGSIGVSGAADVVSNRAHTHAQPFWTLPE